MLIIESYFFPIIVSISIVFFICFYLLLKNKLKANVVRYGGFALAFLVFIVLKTFCAKVYIIDENFNVLHYKSIGTFTVPMKEGAVDISGSVGFNKVGIVNQSNKTLRIDEIVYSSNSWTNPSDNYQDIQAYSIKEVFLSRGYIDYFFDDRIPDEIEVRGISSEDTKYWIHKL